MHAKARKGKEKKLGKTRISEGILKKKGAKKANFPENRGLQERVLKTGGSRASFCKKLGSESCFEKRVCFKRGFKTQKKPESNFKKTRV